MKNEPFKELEQSWRCECGFIDVHSDGCKNCDGGWDRGGYIEIPLERRIEHIEDYLRGLPHD
jgi:hypothetical protein